MFINKKKKKLSLGAMKYLWSYLLKVYVIMQLNVKLLLTEEKTDTTTTECAQRNCWVTNFGSLKQSALMMTVNIGCDLKKL